MSLEDQLELNFKEEDSRQLELPFESLEVHNLRVLNQARDYFDILKDDSEYKSLSFTEFFVNHYLPTFYYNH